ncbi:MAG: ATP-dependent metallopeptidase FtsH/Yme1/Tma family protein, partial [Niveispirillum sp.]|nr:ATP-dependent metallopeptidase FtsH/Yme1/Tma family protein [Niveispirillum sp.]
MNNFGKNLALWLVIGVLLIALFNLFQTSSTRSSQSGMAYSDLLAEVSRGSVTSVTIKGDQITATTNDNRSFSVTAPPGSN